MSKKIIFNQTGSADVLEIIDVTVPVPKADEVQIKVHSIGLNRAEILFRQGHYLIQPNLPASNGYEAAGVVQAVGDNVRDVAVGDKVAVIPSFSLNDYATYGEIINMPAYAVVKFPEHLTFEQAAASYMQYLTAYGALVEFGKLGKGDVVIINAGASSVGVAAVQIANQLGAIPVSIIRNPSKKQALLNAGAKHVLTADQDIVTEIEKISGGKGAKIAFDPVGGANVATLAQAMAVQGIYFIYGALDFDNIQISVKELTGKQLTLRGYNVFEITGNLSLLPQATTFINQGLATGVLQPIIDKTFDFAQMADAHRYVEQGSQIGKIIVNV